MRATRGQHVVAPGKGQASFLGRRLTRVAGQPSTSARRGSAVRSKPDDVELCREKIDLSKRQLSEELLRDGGANLDGLECYDVTFVGADARVTVRCPKDSYILDAGEAAGLELPSSCRGGICGACVGKVTRGSADQSDIADLSFTLEDHQVEEGLTLLCMSRPLEDCEVETQADWGYSLDTQDWPGPTGYILGKEVDSISNEANT
ncbi:ferredoxin [Chloropicon roscoffensis]|uniref:Ferredoxin n=1 Tax=Chloropicon roscoffensis TaxID=1461544 RepID=A0A7S3FQ02_9CHLO